MTGVVITGLLAGWGVAVPLGAVGVYLVTLTARAGLRTGVAAALGVASVDGAYALLAALGSAALVGVLATIARPLQIVAALVLVAVAVLTLRGALGRRRTLAVSIPHPATAYVRFVLITAVNPATLAYFAALVLGGVLDPTAGPVRRIAFAAAALVASAAWQLLLALGGTVLGRYLITPRAQLVSAVVAAVIILGFAVSLLL